MVSYSADGGSRRSRKSTSTTSQKTSTLSDFNRIAKKLDDLSYRLKMLEERRKLIEAKYPPPPNLKLSRDDISLYPKPVKNRYTGRLEFRGGVKSLLDLFMVNKRKR